MTESSCTPRRRYQTGRGLWLKPLKVLVRYGRTDAEIAFILSRLSKAALRQIALADDPTDHDIEALAEPGVEDADIAAPAPGGAWTPGMVKWHRWSRGIRSKVRRELRFAAWWARGRQNVG